MGEPFYAIGFNITDEASYQALAEEARLEVYRFGVEASPVAVRRGSGLDQWRSAFTVPAPDMPGTSVGAAVERLSSDGRAVSRLVMVTGGYENRPPRLGQTLGRYRAVTGERPTVHLVQPAGSASSAPFKAWHRHSGSRRARSIPATPRRWSARSGRSRAGRMAA